MRRPPPSAPPSAEGLRATRDCRPTGLSGNFESGGTAIVRLDCQVSYKDLGLLGIPGSLAVEAEGHAPIDTYRSTDERAAAAGTSRAPPPSS